MTCRPGCAACCIALSISTAMPGYPKGKPAGEACIHLDAELRCSIYHDPRRPKACAGLQPSAEMCGTSRDHALAYLRWLDEVTTPAG